MKIQIRSTDFNFEAKVSQISKIISGDMSDKIVENHTTTNTHTKLLKEFSSKFKMLENRINGVFKVAPGETPIKRHEIDQERLKYLGSVFILIFREKS